MPRRSTHHWHIVLDDQGKPTPMTIAHDHLVNPGRRHAHYRTFAQVLAALRRSAPDMDDGERRARAIRLDDTAATTLDFDREPVPQLDDAAEVRKLHPEVRPSLS